MAIELTPADYGIAAAALDDARRTGLGDDDSADMIFWALVANNKQADYEQRLYKFAYGLIAKQKSCA